MSDPQDTTPFVLFADDNEDTLALLVLIAQKKGWRVDTATTAREIIAKVNHHCSELGRCYDAILSDVNFFDNQPGPRLTGITAIGEIRKRWPSIPVVFYSAFLNTSMRDQIKALGNTDAVEKVGHSNYGEPTDALGVIERVEMALRWIPKYSGQERRGGRGVMGHPHRRVEDCPGDEVKVSEALESVMTEARALHELHATATGGLGYGPSEQPDRKD